MNHLEDAKTKQIDKLKLELHKVRCECNRLDKMRVEDYARLEEQYKLLIDELNRLKE